MLSLFDSFGLFLFTLHCSPKCLNFDNFWHNVLINHCSLCINWFFRHRGIISLQLISRLFSNRCKSIISINYIKLDMIINERRELSIWLRVDLMTCWWSFSGWGFGLITCRSFLWRFELVRELFLLVQARLGKLSDLFSFRVLMAYLFRVLFDVSFLFLAAKLSSFAW